MSADDDWEGGWGAHDAQRRRELASLSPLARIEWLEEMLTFAAEHGLLAHDRAQRARRAARWDPIDAR